MGATGGFVGGPRAMCCDEIQLCADFHFYSVFTFVVFFHAKHNFCAFSFKLSKENSVPLCAHI